MTVKRTEKGSNRKVLAIIKKPLKGNNTKEDEQMKVSYECTELIKELRHDISEFGDNLEVFVITDRAAGVTIYKDYDFELPETSTGEKVEKISAKELLRLYESQNRII